MHTRNLTGEQFGNYRLIRLLGAGSFADVYLGEHLTQNARYAVKVLDARLTHAEGEAFRQEARLFAGLLHPHLIRFLEFSVEDGTPFVAMDYAPRGTLRQRYPANTPLPPEWLLPHVKQAAGALNYMHDRQLIHGEVKPENLLLGRKDEVLLSDFGIASMVYSLCSEHTEALIGTIGYMAPEQMRGQVCPASDQYALGVMIYEWLTGVLPFTGAFSEVAAKQLSISPLSLREQVPALSPEIDEVVLRALAKSPDMRFASIQAFANAFEQVCPVTSVFSSLPAYKRVTMEPVIEVPPTVRIEEQPPGGIPPVSAKPFQVGTTSSSLQILPEKGVALPPAKTLGSGLSLVGGILGGVAFFLPWFQIAIPQTSSSGFTTDATYSYVEASPVTTPSFFSIIFFLAVVILVCFSTALFTRNFSRKSSIRFADAYYIVSIIGLLDTLFLAIAIPFTLSNSVSIEEHLIGFWLALSGFITSFIGSILITQASDQPRKKGK